MSERKDIGGKQIDAQDPRAKIKRVIEGATIDLDFLWKGIKNRKGIKNTEPGPETGVYGPNGTWGMEPLAYDAVHLDLGTIG